MSDVHPEARHTGLPELSLDPVALSVWEAARRSSRPATAAALASAVGQTLAAVQSSIDRLEGAGLISRIPARRMHRATRYVATRERLVLTLPLEAQPSQSRLAADWERWRDTHHEPIVANDASEPPESTGSMRYWFCGMADLAEGDAMEVARRIRALVDFLHLVADRRRAQEDSGNGSPRKPHAISVRLDPVAPDAPPFPVIESVAGSVDGWNGHVLRPVGTNAKLSASEQRIADAMVQGMSRPDIARTLGVSINTVGTLARRMFRKLGVRSRAELVALFAPLPPPRTWAQGLTRSESGRASARHRVPCLDAGEADEVAVCRKDRPRAVVDADRRHPRIVNARPNRPGLPEHRRQRLPVPAGFRDQLDRRRCPPRLDLRQRVVHRRWRVEDRRMGHDREEFMDTRRGDRPGRAILGERSHGSACRPVARCIVAVRRDQHVRIDGDHPPRPS
jgi:DNA-binding CsgD family transcriptional regulator